MKIAILHPCRNTGTTTFGYDYRGRRTSVTDQNGKTTTYAYDDADRLTSVTDAATPGNVTTYGYDTESNLTSIQDANNHTTSFTYDAFGRVTRTTFPSGYIETYGYDADNNLSSKTDRKNQQITYTYDQLNRQAGKTYPDSTAVNYTYDSFGKQTNSSGSLTNPFQFTGRELDAETGLYFYRARYYDSSSSRFLSEDPIRFSGGADFYTYVGNNPIYWIDPLGLREGSPSNLAKRAAIDKIARSHNGDHDWDKDRQKDNFPNPSNKCNKFVCDVLNEAGTPLLVTPKGAAPRCARAGELANPKWTPPCWRSLGVGEAPQPGDVAAYPLSGGGRDFSGHSGIITTGGNMSAHSHGVGPVPGQFDPNIQGILFRRYICD